VEKMDLIDIFILRLLNEQKSLDLKVIFNKVNGFERFGVFSPKKKSYSKDGISFKIENLEKIGVIEIQFKKKVEWEKRIRFVSISQKGKILLDQLEDWIGDNQAKKNALHHPGISQKLQITNNVEISEMTLEEMYLGDLVAESVFGDIDMVPEKYQGTCQKAQEKIIHRLRRFFMDEGITVVDD
jgi:hypothetical protein